MGQEAGWCFCSWHGDCVFVWPEQDCEVVSVPYFGPHFRVFSPARLSPGVRVGGLPSGTRPRGAGSAGPAPRVGGCFPLCQACSLSSPRVGTRLPLLLSATFMHPGPLSVHRMPEGESIPSLKVKTRRKAFGEQNERNEAVGQRPGPGCDLDQ